MKNKYIYLSELFSCNGIESDTVIFFYRSVEVCSDMWLSNNRKGSSYSLPIGKEQTEWIFVAGVKIWKFAVASVGVRKCMYTQSHTDSNQKDLGRAAPAGMKLLGPSLIPLKKWSSSV